MTDPNAPQSGESSQALVKKNLGGRPTLLDEAMTEAICKSLRGGVFLETAAAKQGINAGTLREWLRRGARELRAGVMDSIYAQFTKDVQKADAEAEERLTLFASKAAEKYWMAAIVIMERRWPGRWKRPTDDRENKRAVMEAVLTAIIDTIQIVRTARPGMTDDELVAHVFDQIQLPFDDAPEPTSPRDVAASTPIIEVRLPGTGGPQAPASGPVIDVEAESLEEKRSQEAEKVLKGGE